MSPVLIAVLAFSAAPSEEGKAADSPTAAALVRILRDAKTPRREGNELRQAVRTALRRWARPTDAQADDAAREFITLYVELRADDELARSQRDYYRGRVRSRLIRLSDQISKRIAREERLAKAGKPKTAGRSAGSASASASMQDAPSDASRRDYTAGKGSSTRAFGGRAMGVPDYGPQLVDLIQTVIHPETWDVNGGYGSIYYWYPGRALVVRHRGDVHEEIGGALELLRRAGR